MSTFTRPLAHKFVAIVTIVFVTALLVPAPEAAAWLRERKGVRPAQAPTKAEREAKVAKLELIET